MNFVVEADWDRYLLDTVVIIKISVCVTETEKWRNSVNFVTAVSPLSIKTCRGNTLILQKSTIVKKH